MDPWTAVEAVLCLCAVSLDSSGEDFSETSLGVQRILLACTNSRFLRRTTTNSLVRVVLQCTRQGFSVNKMMMNGMMDALQPLRQKFPVTNEDPVHRKRGRRQQGRSSCERVWLEEFERDCGLGISRAWPGGHCEEHSIGGDRGTIVKDRLTTQQMEVSSRTREKRRIARGTRSPM